MISTISAASGVRSSVVVKTSYLYVSENRDGYVTDVGFPLLELIHQKDN